MHQHRFSTRFFGAFSGAIASVCVALALAACTGDAEPGAPSDRPDASGHADLGDGSDRLAHAARAPGGAARHAGAGRRGLRRRMGDAAA